VDPGCGVNLLEMDLDRVEERCAHALDPLAADAAKDRQRGTGLDMGTTLGKLPSRLIV
jgi:hypothetical protein